MIAHWKVNTFGDPLCSVQTILEHIWRQAGLQGMLIPSSNGGLGMTKPRLIQDPAELAHLNPFRPVMTLNAARLIPALLDEHPGEKLGILLRPCELRALIEMVKHRPLALDRLLTISVDCLGTFPPDDYLWRVERKGSADLLTDESLRFARQGGILAYRYRAACQFCASPFTAGAQVNIGVLGLPVRQYLVITTRDDHIAEQIRVQAIPATRAEQKVVDQRERLLARLDEQHSRTRERVLVGLADYLPVDVDSLIQQFNQCGSCNACMLVCPICAVDFPRAGEDQKYLRQDVMRWLVSCAGCGMCELACPEHRPLTVIFTHLREQLTGALDYTPGISIDQGLPIA